MVHGAAGLLAEGGVGGDQQGEGARQLRLEVHHPLLTSRSGLLVLGGGLRLLPQQQLVQEDPRRGRGVANLEKMKTLLADIFNTTLKFSAFLSKPGGRRVF